jgi:hypothetical protein
VTVCATHARIHLSCGGKAKDLAELRALTAERRRRAERRESLPCDELGAQLIAGFAGERRANADRRR